MKMKLEEKQLNHELLYECNFLKLYRDEVLLPNEKTSSRVYIMHNSAAAVLPITTEGKILLVKQYRYPIRSESIEIPAGKKDFLYEAGLDCARRELEEETGYVSEDFELLRNIHSCVGYSNEMIEIFIAKNCVKKENPAHSDEDEFLELMETSIEEVKAMLKMGMITDAKTLIALQQYLLMTE